jgi:hypothetical protein
MKYYDDEIKYVGMGGACNTRVGDQNYEQAFKREV